MRRFLLAVSALAFMLSLSGGVDAKQCRDAKGKFIKCATPAPNSMMMAGPKKCRDAKGKFIKCKTK